MAILLLNAGSSSLKCSLVEPGGAVVASHAEDVPSNGHAEAVRRFVRGLGGAKVSAVGHRVVHGGPFTESVRVTPQVRERLKQLADLAPLHNPPSLDALAAAEEALPDVPHVAVFDTSFHATLPPEAFTYPVPAAWSRDWGIRRYGFHGLSHAYCAGRAAEMLGRPAAELLLVICHLGNGCSASAVSGGRCVDTTMGFTPLDGLMMGTRCGSIDPSIVLHVQKRHAMTADQVDESLNRRSGLLGVSELSGDMRQVQGAANAGNAQAKLAIGTYTHRVRQAVGALSVTMGGVDALVFTAGVGEHSAEVRRRVCVGLSCLGLQLDEQANAACKPDADVSATHSRGRVLVIATREDVTMLREVVRVVGKQPAE